MNLSISQFVQNLLKLQDAKKSATVSRDGNVIAPQSWWAGWDFKESTRNPSQFGAFRHRGLNKARLRFLGVSVKILLALSFGGKL